MSSYTKYNRGSEWRKWDIHIHTPETKKNDLFDGTTPEEQWKKYVDTINLSPEEITVVGITDYFSIENYFKFKELIKTGKITKDIELVLPNIEIRVVPIAGTGTPVNLHCIFNPAIDSEIETRFLSKLKFDYNNSNYSAKKEELIRLGRKLPGNSSLDESSALKAGIAQYVVTVSSLKDIFEKDGDLRENVIITVSNKSNDGASGIVKHADFFTSPSQSQLDATRWSIYQFCDAIFSSNPGDILYFLGLGPDAKEVVIEKCTTLMPCFHGCDAHSNDKIFKPDQNRFCWIKADPTFEGLKQTLYEPEDRVKIQALKPDVKNDRFIISALEFVDKTKLFGNQKILLNENLNSIIGGKSSGKSLLLYSAAKSIDPDQVARTSKRLGFDGYDFKTNFDFKVIWKNNDEDLLSVSNSTKKLHKITYIPQLYINHLVEKNNKQELNELIKGILLQDTEFKEFYETTFKSIADETTEIDRLLSEYLKVRLVLLDTQKKIKELGATELIKKGITNVESEISKGQKSSNLSEEEFKEYNALTQEKDKLEKTVLNIVNQEKVFLEVLTEMRLSKSTLFGIKDGSSDVELPKGRIDIILSAISELTPEIQLVREKLEADYEAMLNNLVLEISKLDNAVKLLETAKNISAVKVKLEPFDVKIEGQKELQKLFKQLEEEKVKLNQSDTLEKQLKTLSDEYTKIRKQTSVLLKKRYSFYKSIETRVNETKNNIGSEIILSSKVIYKQDDLLFFEQVNKAALTNDHKFNSFFKQGLVDYDAITDFYAEFLRVVDDKLYYGKEDFIPLKLRINLENVLRGLVKDSFSIDYSVSYKGDDLLSMSPGKKGTVLLILFLQISSSEFPILIDQPEDNLDNRTIYELLCKMIREKKKDRQIIIVSHNANLVVATDSENIIVANQEALNATSVQPDRYQFEYVNGSIEYSFAKRTSTKGVLYEQGIKEHVCDILEGGNEAFKQRERKYSLK